MAGAQREGFDPALGPLEHVPPDEREKPAEDQPALAPWATAWYDRVAREFVTEYVRAMGETPLLPRTEESLRTFLELLVIEKALHEIDSDLAHRPEWVAIPLRGALRLLGYDANDPEPRV